MNIGERIRNRRIELGLTQDEVAKKTGYKSRSSINKIESSRNLPLSKVEKMAKALECTPSFLMGWEEQEIMANAMADALLSDLSPKAKELALKLAELSEDSYGAVEAMLNALIKKGKDWLPCLFLCFELNKE